MPPPTISTSDPSATRDGPADAERAPHADDRARLEPAQRPGGRADGADRVAQRPVAARAAADRDRHLADPERVEHRELPGLGLVDRLVDRLERERDRVGGLHARGR